MNNTNNSTDFHFNNNDKSEEIKAVFNRYHANGENDRARQPIPMSSESASALTSPSPYDPMPSNGFNLPRTLESYAALASHQSRVETAVRQHVGTQVKSMYRLAASVGIGRAEFERLVRTEVELLGIGEEEDG